MPPKGYKKAMRGKKLQTLFQNIANGMPFKFACRLTGIGETTFYAYKRDADAFMERGQEPTTPEEKFYVKFRAGLDEAEARAIQRNVGIINLAAKDNWQAAAWWLERTFPDFYARRFIERTTESTTQLIKTGNVQMDLSKLTADELDQMERLLLKAAPPAPHQKALPEATDVLPESE